MLHLDLNNLQQPSAADCEQLASAFPDAVSLIEWAEQLKDWGAAPEQRLALYFRMLPAVGAVCRRQRVGTRNQKWGAAHMQVFLSVRDGCAQALCRGVVICVASPVSHIHVLLA